MTLGPEWRPHPTRDGLYFDPERPGWMRDREGRWYADPDETRAWYRDPSGRIVWLAQHEPSAAEQAELTNEWWREAVEDVRRAARKVLGV